MTDDKRDVLLAALREQRAAEEAVAAAATVDDRAATGTLERWSLRDNLAHIAHWRRELAAALAVARGGGPVREPFDDEVGDAMNADLHAEWRDKPWDEVELAARGAMDALIAEVGQWDSESLHRDWADEGAVYARVTGNSMWHPISHLATWLQQNDRGQQARALYEACGERAMRVDPSERNQGTTLYNLACFQALDGDRDSALTTLADAFGKRPELAMWSLEDSDLASLHDDPAFRALLPQH